MANRLKNEKSPYLRQHSQNPVDWYPWAETARERARTENKPILLSIGYSTCHWCHVMAHESFSDPGIAALMNRHFICIKVDREERPEIDALYIRAVSSLTGSAGWPLNVFLTPELKPFFGGTYFPPSPRPGVPAWPELLERIATLWADPAARARLVDGASELVEVLGRPGPARAGADSKPDVGELVEGIHRHYRQNLDARRGGFGPAPKFPSPSILGYLISATAFDPSIRILPEWRQEAMVMARTTLDAMAGGGIFDQVGGGFHRYATDTRWHVPHFEKMLYDNAQLIETYCDAYAVTGKAAYREVAEKTLGYVLRDLSRPGGGFYGAEDADSLRADGKAIEEGAFYVWTADEFAAALDPDTAAVAAFRYGVEPRGNVSQDPQGAFIGKNILFCAHSAAETAERFSRSETEIRTLLTDADRRLFSVRERRPRPHRDEKVLSDWNGLMLSALARAGNVLDNPAHFTQGTRTARFIDEHLWEAETRTLFRRWCDGERAVLGTATDYTFLCRGLLDLFGATGEGRWLLWAIALAEETLARFFDAGTGRILMADPAATDVIVPVSEESDGVLPSAGTVAATTLLRLTAVTHRPDFHRAADALISAAGKRLQRFPAMAPGLVRVMAEAHRPAVVVYLAGPPTDESLRCLAGAARSVVGTRGDLVFLDGAGVRKALASSTPAVDNMVTRNGRPAAYPCVGTQCQAPTVDPDRLRESLARAMAPSTGYPRVGPSD